MSNIPTPEDAKLFAQSVRKWQQILSLGDWRIEKGSKPVANTSGIRSHLTIR